MRSTVTVTALSAEEILLGRQMCSSTSMAFTPDARLLMSIEVSACFLTAFGAGVPVHPSRRAIADTVVSSSRSRLTAHSTAWLVSLARGGAKSCSSVQVPRRHEGSGQRQIRLRHRTRTGVPKHGASYRTWTCRSWRPRPPAVRTTGQIGVGLDVQHHQALFTANVGIAGDVEDVHVLHAEQLIGPSTPRRVRSTRTVTHARPWSSFSCLVAADLGSLVRSRPGATPWARTPHRETVPPGLSARARISDGDVENRWLAPSPRGT